MPGKLKIIAQSVSQSPCLCAPLRSQCLKVCTLGPAIFMNLQSLVKHAPIRPVSISNIDRSSQEEQLTGQPYLGTSILKQSSRTKTRIMLNDQHCAGLNIMLHKESNVRGSEYCSESGGSPQFDLESSVKHNSLRLSRYLSWPFPQQVHLLPITIETSPSLPDPKETMAEPQEIAWATAFRKLCETD